MNWQYERGDLDIYTYIMLLRYTIYIYIGFSADASMSLDAYICRWCDRGNANWCIGQATNIIYSIFVRPRHIKMTNHFDCLLLHGARIYCFKHHSMLLSVHTKIHRNTVHTRSGGNQQHRTFLVCFAIATIKHRIADTTMFCSCDVFDASFVFFVTSTNFDIFNIVRKIENDVARGKRKE